MGRPLHRCLLEGDNAVDTVVKFARSAPMALKDAFSLWIVSNCIIEGREREPILILGISIPDGGVGLLILRLA